MGYDVASLRLEVDSSGLVKGTKELDKFGASTKSVDKLATGLVKSLGALGAAVGVGAAFSAATEKATGFDRALAEVSTLIKGTPAEMNKLRESALGLSNAYGKDLTANTQSFYTAISAGFGDLKDAADIVDYANKLAKGGVTDLGTATEGLTSVMNAYQAANLTAADASDALFTGMKLGKALDLDTPIPTPRGFVRIGDIKDGDTIYDENGEEQTVVHAHPVIEDAESYEVEFSDGTVVLACRDHNWLTYTDEDRRAINNQRRNSRYVSKSGRKSRAKSAPNPQVRTTKEIADDFEPKNAKLFKHRHYVQMAEPVQYPARRLPIDPYLLGVWLGDGAKSAARIATMDMEIVEAFEDGGYRVSKVPGDNCDYGVRCAEGKRLDDGSLIRQIKALNVFENKHVPETYLTASVDQRLAILRGLMDTDGYISEDGNTCEFVSTDYPLAAAVKELVASLGMTAKIKEKQPREDSHKVAYRVTFTPTRFNPFRLKRKAERVKPSYQANRFLGIVAVRPVASRPMRCLTVTGENALFLCGRSYIVTHNTTIAELSGSLGRVAPFAQGAGLAFDELVASISIATKGGIQTSEAVSGLKAALDNITKPTADAAKLSEELGLGFGATALEGTTLIEFLENLREKTGGSVEALNALFGSVEGKTFIMSLLGSGFEDLSAAMGEFGAKAGATDDAVEKMANSLSDRLDTATNKLSNAGIGIGELGLQLQVFAAEGAVEALDAFNAALEGTPGASDAAREAVQWFADTLQNNVTNAAGAAGDAVAAMKSLMEGDVTSAFESLAKLGDKLNEYTMQGQMENLFEPIFERLKESLENEGAELESQADRVMGGVSDAFTNADVHLGKEAFTNLQLQLQAQMSEAYRNGFGAPEVEETATAAVVDTTAAVAATVKRETPEFFIAVGSDISAGMARGIIENSDEVEAAARKVVKAAEAAARDEADTHSPSKVFAAIGEDLMAGLSEGIVDGDITGLVADEVSKLIEAYEDASQEIANYASSNGTSAAEALLGDSANPRFWSSFQALAIDSWATIMEVSFSEGGAAMTALSTGLTSVMEKVSAFNAAEMEAMYARIPEWVDFKTPSGQLLYSQKLQEGSDLYNMYYANSLQSLRSREVTDYGLKGYIGAEGGGQMEEWWKVLETRTNAAGEKYTVTINEDKGNNELRLAVKDVSEDIRDTIRVFSDAVGGSSDKINDVKQWFNFSAGTGDDALEQMKDGLVTSMEDYTEKLAKAVLNSRTSLLQAGESWSEALERVAQDFWDSYGTFELLGAQQFANTVAGADYNSKLMSLFGGSDAFNSAAMTYFNTAYSAEQQSDSISSYIQSALGSVGLGSNMPTTRGEYKSLVEAQNLTTETGRSRYQTLVSLADMFDAILPAFDAATDGIDDTADAAADFAEALTTISGGLSGLISEATSASTEFENLAESLAESADSIRMLGQGDADTLATLQQKFNALYSSALGGDAEAMADLGTAASAYASAAKSQAQSTVDYQFITSKIATKLDNVADVAADEAALSAYEAESLQALYDAIDAEELTNKLVQDTVNAIGGLEASLMDALRETYEGQTGKAPGFATGGYHRGGLRVVGERGPELEATGPSRIYSNAQTRGMLGIDALREDMAQMHNEIRSLAIKDEKHGRKIEAMLTRWETIGMPVERAS